MNKLYDKDYVAWADEQALLLEQKRFGELDLAHLVEEVRDLGGKHRDALESQLIRLLMHLLKWQYQGDYRTNSWRSTIKEARKQIARLIYKHLVLKIHAEISLEECYMFAREDAAEETGLPIKTFPLMCPYSLEQIQDSEFLPDQMVIVASVEELPQ